MFKSLVGAVALFACVSSAHAALVVQSGNIAQNDDNVINGGSCGGSSSGLTLEGCFNNGQTNPIVNFASDEDLVYAAGGQAKVDGASGDYSRLTISVDGYDIDTLILNINTSLDGYVRFTDGTDTSSVFAVSGAGNNFFTITGGGFDFLSFMTYSNVGGTTESNIVEDVRQVRIGVADVQEVNVNIETSSAVSEPATVAIFSVGLVALGLAMRRRKRG